MTNYEKIKSLSLDKMAKFLDNNLRMYPEHNCENIIKDWLKAESEESEEN